MLLDFETIRREAGERERGRRVHTTEREIREKREREEGERKVTVEIYIYVCVCVCVCERKREREKKRKGKVFCGRSKGESVKDGVSDRNGGEGLRASRERYECDAVDHCAEEG